VEGAGHIRGAQPAPPPRPTGDAITLRARALRKSMSEPEVMLWSRLRGRSPERPTFRRQYPIGTITVDFFCPSARLAIEVDGRTHWDEEARAKDAARDRWLAEHGIAVLRLPAGEIYRDLDAVSDAIFRRAAERLAEMQRMRPAPSTPSLFPRLDAGVGERSPSRHFCRNGGGKRTTAHPNGVTPSSTAAVSANRLLVASSAQAHGEGRAASVSTVDCGVMTQRS